MKRLLPLSMRARLEEQRRFAKNKTVVLKANRIKSAEVKVYNTVLDKLVFEMTEEARQTVVPLLHRLEAQYTGDSYAADLNAVMLTLRSRWRDITPLAQEIARKFVGGVDLINREAFHRTIEKAIGLNFANVIQVENLGDILGSAVVENVNLIQSIPDEYFKKLVTIVNEGTSRGNKAGGMIADIMDLGQSTHSRAKVIARDQTQKVNSAITQARQESLGIEEYRWRTVGDERTRATHRANNGKIFRWDDPPAKTGHPGQDIQCRCFAEPVIKLE